MIGLGGGSISTYLGRFLPEAKIDTVELDKRVISVAKTYSACARASGCAISTGDGRVFPQPPKDPL